MQSTAKHVLPERLPAPALFVKPSTQRTSTVASTASTRAIPTQAAKASHARNASLSRMVTQSSNLSPTIGPPTANTIDTEDKDAFFVPNDSTAPTQSARQIKPPIIDRPRMLVNSQTSSQIRASSAQSQSNDESASVCSSTHLNTFETPQAILDNQREHQPTESFHARAQSSQDHQVADLKRTLAEIERHAKSTSSASVFGNPFDVEPDHHHNAITDIGSTPAISKPKQQGDPLVGRHIFGAQHAAALEQLRNSQLKLVQAWRSTDNDTSPSVAPSDVNNNDNSTSHATRPRHDTNASHTSTNTSEGPNVKNTNDQDDDNHDKNTREETSAERRRQNDIYFAMVKSQVDTVVANLRLVTDAMKRVEVESRDMWSSSASLSSTNLSGTDESGRTVQSRSLKKGDS